MKDVVRNLHKEKDHLVKEVKKLNQQIAAKYVIIAGLTTAVAVKNQSEEIKKGDKKV